MLIPLFVFCWVAEEFVNVGCTGVAVGLGPGFVISTEDKLPGACFVVGATLCEVLEGVKEAPEEAKLP